MQKPTIKYRLGSMLMDHAIMTMIIVPLMMLFEKIDLGSPYVFYLLVLIYINKDFFNAKSVAKRVLGFQVIDRKSGEPASELQCLIRNMTIPIMWPLEVIISIFFRHRRVGDLLANTRVETRKKVQARTILEDMKSMKITKVTVLTLATGFAYVWLLSFGFLRILP